MKDEEINKIAEAIAAKLAEPGGKKLLGCGSASSSTYYGCTSGTYSCSSYYECGGASDFHCVRFRCLDDFGCALGFGCITTFDCEAKYVGPY